MTRGKSRLRPPGPSPLTAKRDKYVRLMNQGMGNSEACREVGVNRRTGTRWRHGRTVRSASGNTYEYAPVAVTSVDGAVAPGRSLTEDERAAIADGLWANETMTAIATSIGRDISTVSREIKRNSQTQSGFASTAGTHASTPTPGTPRPPTETQPSKRWTGSPISTPVANSSSSTM